MLEVFTEMRGAVDAGGVYRDEKSCRCWRCYRDEGVVDAGGVYRDEDGCRCWRCLQR